MGATPRDRRGEASCHPAALGPVNTVSIMEFADEKVVRETLYSADPFDPPKWRAE
jgi:hypothetical protein